MQVFAESRGTKCAAGRKARCDAYNISGTGALTAQPARATFVCMRSPAHAWSGQHNMYKRACSKRHARAVSEQIPE